MADFSIPYSDYLKFVAPLQGWSGGGDAGFTQDPNVKPMSQDEWNAMSPQDRYAMLRHPTTAISDSSAAAQGTEHFQPVASTEDQAAFQQKFGKTPWGKDESGLPQESGKYLYGYGDINDIVGGSEADPRQWMIDPSRVLQLPDGRWVIEADNVSGKWLAQKQATSDRHWNQGVARSVGTMATAALGAYLGGAAGTAGSAATDAAESGGTLALNAGGTAVAPYVPSAAGASAGAAGSVIPGTEPLPSITNPPGATMAPEFQLGGTPGSSFTNGIVNGARNAWNASTGWYNNLSPASRFILGTAASQGASAMIRNHAQQQLIDEQNHRTEQQRQDRQRRTSVSAFGDAFKPRGIINGARNGG